MPEPQKVHRLPPKPTTDPSLAKVLRPVIDPPRNPEKAAEFFPACHSFDIGSGSQVDISLFFDSAQPASLTAPKGGFDRHLQSEELFIALEGDWYMPIALCRNPDDPTERPHAEDMNAVLVREGEMFVLLPNVWHTGVWPVEVGKPIKFAMILSGHRAGAGLQGRVDHIVMTLADDGVVVPDL